MTEKRVAERCIGLVGGLGVGATVEYYRRLATTFQNRGATMRLILSHADLDGVLSFLRQQDKAGLTDYLRSHFRALEAAGAGVVAIAAVAAHMSSPLLWSGISLRYVDIVDAVLAEIEARRIARVAIFGTSVVMTSRLFGRLREEQVVRPSPAEEAFVAGSYAQLAATGDPAAADAGELRSIALKLVRQGGADAVLLAGTELSLLFDEASAGFPSIDATSVHVAAIAEAALAARRG